MYIFGQEYIAFLQEALGRSKVVSGGRELQTRCKDCPDSSDPGSFGHLYISIPQSEEEVSLFDCKKCGAHGMIDTERLMRWGIYQEGISIGLSNHNKKALQNKKNFKYIDRDVYYLRNQYIREGKLSDIKLRYINNRIGTHLTMEDIKKLKIILNLEDVLKANKITDLSRSQNIVHQLDQNFMGFISADNAFVNLRRLVDEGKVYETIDKRYVNYNIFSKFSNTERFYTVPNTLQLERIMEPIQIHIAEGSFDILSIQQNLRQDVNYKSIFTSVGGSGYMGVAQYFISKMKLPYTELHIYPDNDKSGSDKKMQYISNEMKRLGTTTYIHRNLIGKDFGVKPSEIKESIYTV